MNKSAGVLLGIIVAGAAIHTAGAWYTGTQLEGVLNTEIRRANEQLGDALVGTNTTASIELVSLQTHLYSSTAQYRLNFKNLEPGSEHVELLVLENLEHGPLPFSRVKQLKLWPVLASSQYQLEKNPLTEKWFAATQGVSPLNGQMTLGYDRSITGTLSVLPFELAPDADSAVKFSGLNLAMSLSSNAEQVKLDGFMEHLALRLVSADRVPMRFEFNGLTVASDLHKSPFDFYIGGSVVELKDTQMSFGDNQPTLVFKQIEQRDNLQVTGDFLSASLAYKIAGISYADKSIGSMQMAWSAKQVDVPALKALGEMYQAKLQAPEQQAAAARGEVPQIAFSAAEQALLQIELGKLLAGKPQLALDNLSLKTANGESHLSLAVDLAKPASFDLAPDEQLKQVLARLQAQARVSKPMLLDLTTLQVELDAQPSADAVKAQAMMLSSAYGRMLLSTGLFKEEGENLVSNLNYAEQQVDLNGQKISLEQFVMLLMANLGGSRD